MFGTLKELEIETVLHGQVIGRIGCHYDNTTYVVPISYAYDGEFIYALTTEGLKINMMRHNDEICFEVEDIPNLGNWKTVICWGKYEELTEREARHHALMLLQDRPLPYVTSATTRLSAAWPFKSKEVDQINGIVFRIRITKKTGKYEKQEEASISSWQ